MQQIKSMQSGLLMPMVFIYFLHFRMKQMQPLLMQTVTGVMNLVYSPLWQVYVMGKRLERPFGSGGGNKGDGLMSDGMGENESDVSEVVETDDDDANDAAVDVNNESDEDETEEEDSDDESDNED